MKTLEGIKNPFEYGRELGTDELIDREEEIAEVLRTVRNGGKLFLIGPRRFGKTSILKAAEDQAGKQGMIVLRFNAEAFPSVEELIRRIVEEGAKRLVGQSGQLKQTLKRVFRSIGPKFTFDYEGHVEVSFGNQPEESERIPMMVDALDGIEALATDLDKPVGIMIDEFQRIIEIGGDTAEGQLRAAVQQHRKVGYVFAGSKTRMLADMTGNASRPFYRLGERRFLKEIPRDLFKQALDDSFRKTGLAAEASAIETILSLGEEVPHSVQRLAHACWEYSASRSPETLTPETVLEVLNQVVRRDDPFYTQMWNPLTTNQRRTLLATIHGRGVGMLSKQTLKRFNLAVGTAQQTLRTLQEKEILRIEESLGEKRYRFEDPFFAAWIKATINR